MNIDGPERGKFQDLGRQQLPVCDSYDASRSQFCYSFNGLRASNFFRLVERKPARLGQPFHRWRYYFPATSLGSVRLCHHQQDWSFRSQQRFQARQRKLRRTHENQTWKVVHHERKGMGRSRELSGVETAPR